MGGSQRDGYRLKQEVLEIRATKFVRYHNRKNVGEKINYS